MARKLMTLSIILVLMCSLTACGNSFVTAKNIAIGDGEVVFENALEAYNYGADFYKNAFDNGYSYKHTQTGKGKGSANVDIQMYKLLYGKQIYQESMQYTADKFLGMVSLNSYVNSAEQTIVSKNRTARIRTTKNKTNIKKDNSTGILTLAKNDWSTVSNNAGYSQGIFLLNDYDIKKSTIDSGLDSLKFDGKFYTYKFTFNSGGHGDIYKTHVGKSAKYVNFGYLLITFKQDKSGKIVEMNVEEEYTVDSGKAIVGNVKTTNVLKSVIKYDIAKPKALGFNNYNWFKDFSNNS